MVAATPTEATVTTLAATPVSYLVASEDVGAIGSGSLIPSRDGEKRFCLCLFPSPSSRGRLESVSEEMPVLFSSLHLRTHARINEHTHTYIHAHTHTRTHAYINTHLPYKTIRPEQQGFFDFRLVDLVQTHDRENILGVDQIRNGIRNSNEVLYSDDGLDLAWVRG